MIERAHSSHIGINGCSRITREVIFWPGMSTEIELHVRKCNICERYQSDSVKEPLISHEVPKRPWEKIGVDLMEFKQQQYLVTVDYFCNYFDLIYLVTTLVLRAFAIIPAPHPRPVPPERPCCLAVCGGAYNPSSGR